MAARRGKTKSPPVAAPAALRPTGKPVGIKSLMPDEKALLLSETGLDERELVALDAIYSRNVLQGSDVPPVERLRDLPETSVVPLMQRILQKFNDDNSGMISFAEFARALSTLTPRTTLEQKLRFVFSLFDHDGSGTISAVELFGLLRLMMGVVHDDHDLHIICENYLSRFPDGLMTFDHFTQMIDVNDVNKLVLNL